jgi:hypothetical protein
LIAHAQTLRSQGATEENNMEFAKLILMLRQLNQLGRDQLQKESITQSNRDMLKVHVMAYKLLNANKPLTNSLKLKILDKEEDVAATIAQNVAKDFKLDTNPYHHLLSKQTFNELSGRLLVLLVPV